MRFRKENSKWSIKTFFKIFGFLFLFFNLFYVLAGYVDHKEFFNNREFLYNWLLMGVMYPLVLSAISATGFRSSTITIGDFNTIPEFRKKLLSVALKGYKITLDQPTETRLTPTRWFFKIFNAWSGSENVSIYWTDQEVKIHGSQRKVSQLEDSLTWNNLFKP